MAAIEPIVMPKWGLAMQEGLLSAWHVPQGAAIAKGQEIADIETSKIANVFESPVAGHLRRRIAAEGETLPVGGLLAVVADPEIAEAEIDAFIADFQSRFVAAASSAETGGPQPETVEADGRRIRYLKMGTAPGTAFLLVHGFGGDLNNWLFNQPDLAEARTTYAIDLPGHGGSSKDVGQGDIASFTAAVLAFMDALGLDRVHYVGHSLGGAVGLDLALGHPGRVASLTLLCPAGLGREISMAFIDGFIATSRARKLKGILEMLVADPALVTNDMVDEVLRYKRLDGVDAALNRMATACFPGGEQALRFTRELEQLSAPTQVIWGEADRIVPAEHAAGLPASMKVVVLRGAGHLAHMEKAQEVNALVRALAAGD
jgi:pyruvate dehydrogenase E2 component (dihydrolipoamide acetyltransferase)